MSKEEKLFKKVELASKIVLKEDEKLFKELGKEQKLKKEIIDYDYYYNPNVKCTCEAIFGDAHRSYCKRRIRPNEKKRSVKNNK